MLGDKCQREKNRQNKGVLENVHDGMEETVIKFRVLNFANAIFEQNLRMRLNYVYFRGTPFTKT